MLKNCQVCEKEFYAKPSHVKKGYGRFCNKTCFDGWQRLQPKGKHHHRFTSLRKKCKQCGEGLWVSLSRWADGRGRYCSRKCYGTSMRGSKRAKMSDEARTKLGLKRRGKLNPAYKHGKSRGMIRYQGTFTKLVKERVYEKYGKICQECGVSNLRIDIHHVDNNPLNSVVENLIPLCIICHRRKHKKN